MILSPCSKDLLAETTLELLSLGEISGKTVFIDGTKIEANANKYTFVWKKSVTKNQQKLFDKAVSLVAECEAMYGVRAVYNGQISMRTLKRLRKKLYAVKESEGITFVKGSGKRKTPLQRSIETLESCIDKLKEYNSETPHLRRPEQLFQNRPRRCLHETEGGRHAERPAETGL